MKQLLFIVLVVGLSYQDCPPDQKCSGNYCLEDQTCKFGCYGSMGGPKCNIACGANCRYGSCNADVPDAGKKPQCTYGCMPGFTGSDCEGTCASPNCPGNKCSQKDGKCPDGCKDGKFFNKDDKSCSDACPATCKDGKCTAGSKGLCDLGCEGGNWGPSCTETCPTGLVLKPCLTDCS